MSASDARTRKSARRAPVRPSPGRTMDERSASRIASPVSFVAVARVPAKHRDPSWRQGLTRCPPSRRTLKSVSRPHRAKPITCVIHCPSSQTTDGSDRFMNVSARSAQDGAQPEGRVDDGATLKAAGVWLGQFARTLKTSRLYDAKNPTVVKFRDDLALSARKVLAEYGAITYEFRSDDVLFDETSLYPARSRDDNLALPFYRDGVRSLTLQPGVEPREIDALLDAVLQVTGQNPGDDDLVTLLWEAQLNHVLIDYVPGEG